MTTDILTSAILEDEMKEISKMTDEELDEAIAVEVMGWNKHPDMQGSWWVLDEDKFAGYYWKERVPLIFYVWNPTVDLNQAFEALEKVGYWTMCRFTGSLYHVSASLSGKDEEGSIHSAHSLTRDDFACAICEAVLMAVRGEK